MRSSLFIAPGARSCQPSTTSRPQFFPPLGFPSFWPLLSVVVVVFPSLVVVVVFVLELLEVVWPFWLLDEDDDRMLDDWLIELLLFCELLDRSDFEDRFESLCRFDCPFCGIFPPICAIIFCIHASSSATLMGPLGTCTPPVELPGPLDEFCDDDELVELVAVAFPPGEVLVLDCELCVPGALGPLPDPPFCGGVAVLMPQTPTTTIAPTIQRQRSIAHLLGDQRPHSGSVPPLPMRQAAGPVTTRTRVVDLSTAQKERARAAIRPGPSSRSVSPLSARARRVRANHAAIPATPIDPIGPRRMSVLRHNATAAGPLPRPTKKAAGRAIRPARRVSPY